MFRTVTVTPPLPSLSEAVGNFPAAMSSSVVEMPELLLAVTAILDETPVGDAGGDGSLRDEVYASRMMATRAMLPIIAAVLPRKSRFFLAG